MSQENELKLEKKFNVNYEELINKIVESIERTQVEHVREQAAAVDLELDRYEKVFEQAIAESERSAAILIFAYIEDVMLTTFKRHLNGDVKGGWDEVVGGNGVLATASDRITLLALLRWIKPAVYHDLRTLKSIRNRFAHHAEVNSCMDSKISSWISNLHYDVEDIVTKFQQDFNVRLKPLSKFDELIFKSAYTVVELLSNLAIGPHAEALGINPALVEGSSKEELLSNIAELRNRAAKIWVALLKV